jgi:iron complex outermembrane receptor protein
MIRSFSGTQTATWLARTRLILAVAVLGASLVHAQGNGAPALAGASLEDLMKIDVTSVSKKEESLSRTAAAVFVINQKDIRSSGATNIPDLLRMAPGVEVAQVNANQWAITIRGFNNAVTSDKVLILIDGRTAYVDLTSGVNWDQIDVPLEDIERIEVIRGPGGTIWGANAVNGVINIITKSAADTKGVVVAGGAGSHEVAQGLVQYGADAGSKGAFRIFGKYFDTTGSPLPGGAAAADAWHTLHGGFRSDWGLSARDTLSVQGDFIAGNGGTPGEVVPGFVPVTTPANLPLTNRSGDVLAKWDHTLAGGSTTSLQIYDNIMNRNQRGVREFDNVVDAQFEHHITIGSRQDVVWGLGYRFSRDNLRPTTSASSQINLATQSVNLFSVFAQDEIQVAKSVLVTLGSKLEHNAYTGFELEPTAQLVWTMSARQSVWASVSQAVREPNAVENYVNYTVGYVPIPGVGDAALVLQGNPHLETERMTAYQTGYRAQLNPRLSLDTTAFLNFYRNLVTNEQGNPYVAYTQAGPEFTIPLDYANLARASDYGFEVFANWRVTSKWKISPGYSAMRLFVAADRGSTDTTIAGTPGDSPKQQFEIRSALNLRKTLEWDGSLKYVAALNIQDVPAYVRVDMRLGWRIGEFMELSVTGQNLTSRPRFEFLDDTGLFGRAEVARSVFAKLTWRSR